MKKGEPVPPPKKTGSGTEPISAAATLIVSLPANATLTIDDQPTSSTSSRRVFVSPPLETGRDYSYMLRAEATREDGQTVRTEQRVTVRAGQETNITLQLPAASVTASR